MSKKNKLTLGRTLKHGAALTFSNPGTVVLGFLAELGESLFALGFQVAFAVVIFTWLTRWLSIQIASLMDVVVEETVRFSLSHVLFCLIGGGILATFLVLFLRGIWVGALVRRFSSRLLAFNDDDIASGFANDSKATSENGGFDESDETGSVSQSGESKGEICVDDLSRGAVISPKNDRQTSLSKHPALLDGIQGFSKVAIFSLAFLPVVLTLLLVSGTILGVELWLLKAVLFQGASHVLCALALAFGLTLLIVFNRGACMVFRLGVVKMLSGSRDVLTALIDALRLLWERLGFFVLLFLIFALLEFMIGVGIGVLELYFDDVARFLQPSVVVFLGGILAIALFAMTVEAAAMAVVTSAEYGAFTAVVLDDLGLLPIEETLKKLDGNTSKTLPSNWYKMDEKHESYQQITDDDVIVETTVVHSDGTDKFSEKYGDEIIETVVSSGVENVFETPFAEPELTKAPVNFEFETSDESRKSESTSVCGVTAEGASSVTSSEALPETSEGTSSGKREDILSGQFGELAEVKDPPSSENSR